MTSANPHAAYDTIKTSIVLRRDGWHIVVTKTHSKYGNERVEESKLAFNSEAKATEFAVNLAREMERRLLAGES
jgi:hypothetical protein